MIPNASEAGAHLVRRDAETLKQVQNLRDQATRPTCSPPRGRPGLR
jgi:hypothetical protein